jgi:protein-tyrosine phosphatase
MMRRIEDLPLWVGNVGDVRDPSALVAAGVAAVVDLAVNETPANLPRDIVHCRFPLVDGGGNPAWLLRAAAETVSSFLRAGVPTLVYCGGGMSRTPAIAAAGLALSSGRAPADALTVVARRGAADVSPALWADVQAAIT